MITDVNLSLGRWPFQCFDIRTPRQLAAHLRKHGIAEGWVSAVDSVLSPDPDVYEIVLSFAGEDRDYVEEVASFLAKHDVHCNA